jgi:hypothetical protein
LQTDGLIVPAQALKQFAAFTSYEHPLAQGLILRYFDDAQHYGTRLVACRQSPSQLDKSPSGYTGHYRRDYGE